MVGWGGGLVLLKKWFPNESGCRAPAKYVGANACPGAALPFSPALPGSNVLVADCGREKRPGTTDLGKNRFGFE